MKDGYISYLAEDLAKREKELLERAEKAEARVEELEHSLSDAMDLIEGIQGSNAVHMARVAELEADVPTTRSNEEFVASCNELARTFYKMQGYEVGDDFKFYDSTHPHEVSLWNEAMAAYEHIDGSEVGDALDEMMEDQGGEGES